MSYTGASAPPYSAADPAPPYSSSAAPAAPPYGSPGAPPPTAPPYGSSTAPPPTAPPSAAPPSYAQVSDTKCTYVDFTPRCLESSGIFSMPVYEKFDKLIEKANYWLRGHGQWKVISCESIESKLKTSNAVDTNKSTYSVDPKYHTLYNRSLRLWVCNKTPVDNPEPQQLGYTNLVPKCLREGFHRPDFEEFQATIGNFNRKLAQYPLKGRIINMETQAMKFKSWDNTVHADKCVWRESGEHDVYFLNMIRIFYQLGRDVITKVGTKDFVPVRSGEYYQPFRTVVDQANRWVEYQPPNLNVCNVQSLDCKIKGGYSGGVIDTQRALYCEHGNRSTKYCRFVRVYWTEGTDYTSIPRSGPLLITYRTFVPFRLTGGGLGMGEYDTLNTTAKRMLTWINATGAKVMSCETIKIRAHDAHQGGNPEVTYASDRGNDHRRYILALRLYLDGAYRDPPPGVMPRRPAVQQDDDCCVIL